MALASIEAALEDRRDEARWRAVIELLGRLDGLEPGYNGHARARAIVMHGAPYVSAALASTQGRIGRSWGCPALREAVARDVIDTIRGGGVVFSYYPDADWLGNSRFLNCGEDG